MLADEKYNFEDTWNLKWEKRHENFVMLFINKGVRHHRFDGRGTAGAAPGAGKGGSAARHGPASG
jgi:hypothetical protein